MSKRKKKSLLEEGYKPYLGTLRIRPPESQAAIHLRMSSPNFDLFGDETTAPGVVVYGLTVLNLEDVTSTEKEFCRIISDAGLPENLRLHANELFHEDKRRKTPWGQLSERQVFELASNVLQFLREKGALFSVGAVDQTTYPRTMPSGFGDDIKITPSQLYPMAFWAAVAALNAVDLRKPGIHLRWFLDPQVTRAKLWGIGRMQVQIVYKATKIELEPVSDPKPLLLDTADLFAYIAGRAVSPQQVRRKMAFQELYAICKPLRANMWLIPDDKQLPASLLREQKDSSRIEL